VPGTVLAVSSASLAGGLGLLLANFFDGARQPRQDRFAGVANHVLSCDGQGHGARETLGRVEQDLSQIVPVGFSVLSHDALAP
jgi:hypothetical protein